MTRIVRDSDGTPMVRGVDGDMLPIDEPEPALPFLKPDAQCAEHYGERAIRCRSCFSEILAGERPRSHLGRVWRADDP